MGNKNKLIDQFHKNSQEVVEIHITQWKTQDYVDIRIWMLPNPVNEKERQPTKKGICINAELLPELQKALEKARKTLEKGQEKAEFESKCSQEKRSLDSEYQDKGENASNRGRSEKLAEKKALKSQITADLK